MGLNETHVQWQSNLISFYLLTEFTEILILFTPLAPKTIIIDNPKTVFSGSQWANFWQVNQNIYLERKFIGLPYHISF